MLARLSSLRHPSSLRHRPGLRTLVATVLLVGGLAAVTPEALASAAAT